MTQIQKPFPDLSADEGVTPLLAQYLALKAQHQDCLLFFRLGDFYELFFEDAVKASRALDITLTRRGQMQGQDVPMCGVPFHAYENYLARLMRKGFRVAICEQTEAPAEAKKRGAKSIVTREVVRIVTPGTVTEDSLLDARDTNYLACLVQVGDDMALAWLDLAAGVPFCQEVSEAELSAAFARLNPSEILLPQRLIEKPDLFEVLASWREALTPQPTSRFDSENGHRRLLDIYKVSTLDAFGTFTRAEIAALGALIDYVALTQKTDLSHLERPRKAGMTQVAIDGATRRNLELTRTLQGERHGSLLAAIDKTQTGAGARLLGSRLMAPLTDVAAINRRLDAVGFMLQQSGAREKIREILHHTPDLERALARLALGRGGPRDCAAVRDAILRADSIKAGLASCDKKTWPEDVRIQFQHLGEHTSLADTLQRALAADLPLLTRDGGFIAQGYAASLDEVVVLRDNGRRLIAALQQKYAETSGVSGLKIKHNQVIGYYIEVTPTHADKLIAQPETFIHRQSMANAIRFTTVELGELERKITEAADKALAIELQLFAGLVEDILVHLADLRLTATALAEIDLTTSLATLSSEQNYVRPLIDDSTSFKIVGGRHPVVEQALREQGSEKINFVANDCDLNSAQHLWLLTGPNMAGKSTFLRQNALIVILAQMGSFVPAKQAHIGVVDRLFSRVGAADDLARGRSTFMVEMVETAAILNQAGPRALVILDEIGRGTATFDGLSIAWATIEHLHEVNKCRALFATHYHELTALEGKLSSLYCATMRIKEWEHEIIFLHEVAKGTADRSYGIHVAQMAGLPAWVIARANQVLQVLESKDDKKEREHLSLDLPLFSMIQTPPPVAPAKSELKIFLDQMNPDELTPKEALDVLYKIRQLAAK